MAYLIANLNGLLNTQDNCWNIISHYLSKCMCACPFHLKFLLYTENSESIKCSKVQPLQSCVETEHWIIVVL